MSLDKVGKEKDELKDLNSQLKWHMNDLKAFMYALKKTLITCSSRAETTEKSNLESHLATGWITVQVELPACGVSALTSKGTD